MQESVHTLGQNQITPSQTVDERLAIYAMYFFKERFMKELCNISFLCIKENEHYDFHSKAIMHANDPASYIF